MQGTEHREPQRFAAGAAFRQRTVTTTYTVDPAVDDTIFADATGGAFTINLPAAAHPDVYDPATRTGKVFTFVRTSAAANNVTIDGNGAETINGAATNVLSAQYARIAIMSNGTAWINV